MNTVMLLSKYYPKKKIMIKTVFYLILGLLTISSLHSCKKNQTQRPTLNFSRSVYILKASAPLTVELRASEAPDKQLTIPVLIEGSAKQDEDYTLSSNVFILEAGETTAAITVTPKNNLTPEREIKLSLPTVEGYVNGDKKESIVVIEVKEKIMYSFTQSSGSLLGKMNITVELKGEISGTSFLAPQDIIIPFSILENSTAKLDENFSITDNATNIVIKEGTRRGTVELNFLSTGPEGQRKAFLELGAPLTDPEYYYAGSYKTFTCVVTQLKFRDLLGKWKPVGITNEDVFPQIFEPQDYISSLPTNNNPDDYLEFVEDGSTDKIIPHLTGDLKNFFSGPQHEVVFDHIEPDFEDYSTFTTFDIPYFVINDVNVLFSATQMQKGNVFIGLEKIDDNNMLIYFHDYIPTDFFSMFYADEEWPKPDYTPFYGITYKFTRVQ